jgi:hypothetical protein
LEAEEERGTRVKTKLLTVAWSDLCGEERELVVEWLTEAGRGAALEQFAAIGRGSLKDEGAGLAAYLQTLKDALGSHWPIESWTLTREDLRVATFCVAFDDQRRLLLGLYPASTDIASLVQEVKQAERLCDAAVVIGERKQRVDEIEQRRRVQKELLPSPPRRTAFEDDCRMEDQLALALMRLNLATSGQGDELSLRLTKERDSAAIEALLNERDQLREEAVEAKTTRP